MLVFLKAFSSLEKRYFPWKSHSFLRKAIGLLKKTECMERILIRIASIHRNLYSLSREYREYIGAFNRPSKGLLKIF
jgi:hypothetical protein